MNRRHQLAQLIQVLLLARLLAQNQDDLIASCLQSFHQLQNPQLSPMGRRIEEKMRNHENEFLVSTH
jgi:hypothetical protein